MSAFLGNKFLQPCRWWGLLAGGSRFRKCCKPTARSSSSAALDSRDPTSLGRPGCFIYGCAISEALL